MSRKHAALSVGRSLYFGELDQFEVLGTLSRDVEQDSCVVNQILHLTSVVVASGKIGDLRFFEHEAPMRFGAVKTANITFARLQPGHPEINLKRLAGGIEVMLERARGNSHGRRNDVGAEAQQAAIEGQDLAALDLKNEILQCRFVEARYIDAPTERRQEPEAVMKESVVITVLLLEVLRLQQHSLSPKKRP